MPGSKSDTNRALLLAALSEGVSRLSEPLASRDTLLMRDALRTLGVRIDVEPGEAGSAGSWIVHGPGPQVDPFAGVQVDCGNAGTVARFLPAAAALADGDVHLVGDARMSERPLAPLLDALRTLGARITGSAIPCTVHGTGRLAGGAVTVNASSSSQLVSGLLLAAPRYDAGLSLRHAGPPVPSAPHLAMTVDLLRRSGATVTTGLDTWRVEPGRLVPLDRAIEPDLSSASAFLAAAAVTGGEVCLSSWPEHTYQPGRMLPKLFEALGCSVTVEGRGLVVRGPDRLQGIDVDLHEYGEAAPTFTALAVLADGPSRLRGIAHLRLQETDRLGALASELGRLGARIDVTADGLAITPAPLHGGTLDPHDDHRLAMAYAVVGLAVPDVKIVNIDTTAKTVPDFPGRWAALLAVAPTAGTAQ
jgi:3-phosphoshikimate 1-carboxyvinyltransferase